MNYSICTQSNGSKYCYVSLTIQLDISHLFTWLNVKQFYVTHRSGATTPSQSGPGSNGNEGVLHIPQISKAGASLTHCLVSYLRHSLGGVLLLYRDTVSVLYCPSQLGSFKFGHEYGLLSISE